MVGKDYMKLTSADQWFGRCIKERVGWTCEKCGKVFNIPDTQGLHTSHFIGRGNYAVRFEPLNAYAHCYGCHSYFEQNPHIFTAWVKDKLGLDLYDILMEKSLNIMAGKEARHELKTIAEHYKSEYERMLSVRAAGVSGRIEFVGWV
jgi:hypothetical protein